MRSWQQQWSDETRRTEVEAATKEFSGALNQATGLVKQITIENAPAQFERDEAALARERLDELWQPSGWEQEVGATEEDLGEGEFPDPGEYGAEPVEEWAPSVAPQEPELAPGPREGQRETVQARALLEKAQRLLDRISAEDRVEVERLMNQVNSALTDRQWAQVVSACNELSDVLFYLEDV